MQTLIKLNIEKYEEKGQEYFGATSDNLQGLVAEGQTLEEVIDIAEDVKRIVDLFHTAAERKRPPDADKALRFTTLMLESVPQLLNK